MFGMLHSPLRRARTCTGMSAAVMALAISALHSRTGRTDEHAIPPSVAAATATGADAESLPILLQDEFERHACCDGEACDSCNRPFLTIRDRLTFGAEYLLLRPTFGNDTALYQTTTAGQVQLTNTALNYDFGYSSGVRGFLGYRLSDDWLVRFSYLTIGSSDTVGGTSSGNWLGGNGTGFLGPYDTTALAAGQSIQSRASVGLSVYDLEIAGRLGMPSCDAAGQSSLWEAAGAVGVRFADVAVDSDVFNDQTALGQLNEVFVSTSRGFHGVGPRLALQGRRYLGRARRWSAFASGGAALLVGSYDNTDTRFRRRAEGGGVITTNLQTQQDAGTLVVPNLDLSLGATWQLGQRTSLSAGWMLMYWGAVGYAEQISTATAAPAVRPDLVPLTNSSLSYDGAFFKLTHNF